MARTDQQIYKAIADVVAKTAPAGWQQIIVNASIADDNGETLHDYIDEASNARWFAPATSDQYEVYTAFHELRLLMTKSGHPWDTVRFTLERNGSFRIEFDYEK